MNTPNIDFSRMPATFGRCLQADCELASTCLRRQAMLQRETRSDFLSVVNPASVAGNEGCAYFIDANRPDVGRGLRLNLDSVPLAKAQALRRALAVEFGYMKLSRMRRGLCDILPAQQKRLAALCDKYGAPAPEYDEMTFPWHSL